MYFQFLIEDMSTEILIGHVIEKLKNKYPDKEIQADCKSFKGIGHLPKSGDLMERKGGNLLNNLPMYLRAFDRTLVYLDNASIVVVVDNDKRDNKQFQKILDNMAVDLGIKTDCVFCIAVKEMEAWLLGDEKAIEQAYPDAKKKYLKSYNQDGICDTWQVLADIVYPGGFLKLQNKSKSSYSEMGKSKCEWADKIGKEILLDNNKSPSFNNFVNALTSRIKK